MVGISAIGHIDMKSYARVAHEPVHKIFDQIRIKFLQFAFLREFNTVNKIRSSAYIKADRCEGLIHGHSCLSVSRYPLHIAKRLLNRLSERDANVFHCMMIVNIYIALCLYLQIKY